MFGSSGKNLKVSSELLKKIQVASDILGCQADEFAEKVLAERCDEVIASTGKREASQSDIDEISNQLKGLGYLE